MPKRFTDTDKWKDEWWGSLDNDYRMVWLYLIDSCSIAGIWKKDFRGMNFHCNTNITEEDFKKVFSGRVIDRPKFFFIPKFLRFQYPKGLNSNKPAIISVVKELHENSLSQMVNQLFGNDYLIIKDIDKDKDTGKGQRQGQGYGPDAKLKLFEELFSDELYVEQLAMTHKGKDINQAWEECFTHHINGKSPPADLGEWRQKLNTWLINTKIHANGTSKKNGKQSAADLAKAFEQRHGTGAHG